MTQLADFSFDVDALGRGKIEINGQDVTDQIAAYRISGRPGGVDPLAVLVEQHPGSAAITGTGVVHVQAATEDVGAAIAEWIDQIDPAALEQQVLASFGGLDPPPTVGDAWLGALRKLAGDA